jgi:hypothetical protein
MFAWKIKRDRENQIQKLRSCDSREDGVNRRAISLVPLPPNQDLHEISLSANLKSRQLLLSLEAKQSTCCLRIISSSRKSRSAVLIYRGLVIGCVYGSKKLEHQIFGQAAHEQALADLAQPDSLVDAYVLSEEIVLAAASLFHGNVMKAQLNKSAHETYYHAVESMIANNSVGCIVLSDTEKAALCMVYLFAGRIAGAYSFAEGWLKSPFEDTLNCLRAHPGSKVMASALNAANESEAVQLCFSLTGLSESLIERESTGANNNDSLFQFTMHNSAAAEEYRTSLQLTHIDSRDSGNQGKKNLKNKSIIKANPAMYSIAPELF